MNKHYWGLWALLLAALLFFVVLSFWQDGFNVGGLEIKTASFARDIGAEMTTRRVTDADTLDADGRLPDGKHPKGWRAPMDTTAKNILFIGDSMLEGLAPRLAKYCDKNGHTLVEVIWYSSSTKCWSETARLTELINKFHPDYIFVCLGANELYVPDIKRARRPLLKRCWPRSATFPMCGSGRPTGTRTRVSTTC